MQDRDKLSRIRTSKRLKPNALESLINEGNVLYAQTKYDEAIACYDRILEVDPKNIDALINKGLALSALAKHDEAIACYDKVLELDPDDVEALHAASLNGKAWILANIGKNQIALNLIEISLRLNPKSPNALDTKAFILYNLRRYKESLKYCDLSIELDPTDAEYRQRKGMILLRLASNRDGKAHFTKKEKFQSAIFDNAKTLQDNDNSEALT